MCIICTSEKADKNKMKELWCWDCPLLINIPIIPGLKELYCSGCVLLKSVPNIPGLKHLNCSRCPLITVIPNIRGLEILECSECPLLKTIPDIPSLEKLYCSMCISLTTLPTLNNMKELWCWGCPLLTYKPLKKISVYYVDCPWLNHPKNRNFEKNIKLLRQLHQKLRWRQIRLYLKSVRFDEWCYSPNGPGGKMTVQRLKRLASE